MRRCHQIAAQMWGARAQDGTRLNCTLYDALTNVDDLCRAAGGTLHSRQVIAAVIVNWQLQHPGETPLP